MIGFALALLAAEPADAAAPVAVANVEAAANAEAPVGKVGSNAINVDVGVDFAAAGRLPMVSTRVGGGLQWALGDRAVANFGVVVGYSYAAGESSVVDASFGSDPNAFVMAHRIPLRLGASFAFAPMPDAGPLWLALTATAGGDVVLATSHSFGRTVHSTALAPGASVGARFLWNVTPGVGLGLTGELDVARVGPTVLAPGLDPDVGAVRLAVVSQFSFGG